MIDTCKGCPSLRFEMIESDDEHWWWMCFNDGLMVAHREIERYSSLLHTNGPDIPDWCPLPDYCESFEF
jgi:hypothetical protein